MPMHDVSGADRRRHLHAQAVDAGVEAAASLALGLATLEAESGWIARQLRTDDATVLVELEKTVKPLARSELAARIRAERKQGLSLRMIGRRLEADGIAAPHGGARWHPSSVRWVATSSAHAA